MREIALSGTIALSLMSMLYSKNFNKRKYTIIFALAFCLGMYIKWAYIIVIVFPIIYYLFSIILENRKAGLTSIVLFYKQQWSNFLVATAIILSLLAPWYLGVLEMTWMKTKVFSETTELKGFTEQLFYYAYNLKYLTFDMFLVVFIAALAIWLIFSNKKDSLIYLLSFLGSYFVLTLIPHKEPRYLIPLLPVVSIIIAGGISTIRNQYFKRAIFLLILVCNVWVSYSYSFAQNTIIHKQNNMRKNTEIECTNSSREIFEKVVNIVNRIAEENENSDHIAIKLFPYNENSEFFNFYIFNYYQITLNAKGHKTLNGAISYDIVSWEDFSRQFDGVDVLVINEIVFETPVGTRTDKNSTHDKQENQDDADDSRKFTQGFFNGIFYYPVMKSTILEKFEVVSRIKSPCPNEILVLKKKTPS